MIIQIFITDFFSFLNRYRTYKKVLNIKFIQTSVRDKKGKGGLFIIQQTLYISNY